MLIHIGLEFPAPVLLALPIHLPAALQHNRQVLGTNHNEGYNPNHEQFGQRRISQHRVFDSITLDEAWDRNSAFQSGQMRNLTTSLRTFTTSASCTTRALSAGSSSLRPFLNVLIPLWKSPMKSDIRPRPNSSSTTMATRRICHILTRPSISFN